MPPDLHANFVERVHQGIDLITVEAAAEVAGRRWIGDAAGADRVQVHRVVSQQLKMLKPSAACQVVVGDVQHVIRFVVRPIHLQYVQPLVDRFGQPELLRQQLHCPDASAGNRPRSVGKLVVDVRRGKLRAASPLLLSPAGKPSLDSSLAVSQSLLYFGTHSKLLVLRRIA